MFVSDCLTMSEPGYGLDQFQILSNVQDAGDQRYKDSFKCFLFFFNIRNPQQTLSDMLM